MKMHLKALDESALYVMLLAASGATSLAEVQQRLQQFPTDSSE